MKWSGDFNQHEAMVQELNKARIHAVNEQRIARELVKRERDEMADYYNKVTCQACNQLQKQHET